MKIKNNLEDKKIYIFLSESEYESEEYKNKIDKLQDGENNIIVFIGGNISAEMCIKDILDNMKIIRDWLLYNSNFIIL